MTEAHCPCGLEKSYEECCGPLIEGEAQAETAEMLMRSRYTAYTKVAMDYIKDTTHPKQLKDYDAKSSQEWAEESEWHGLEILSTEQGGPDDEEGMVEFVAHFSQKSKQHKHHEKSTFKKLKGRWFFEDGEAVKPGQFIRKQAKVKPNDPCPCGSKRKTKKCCPEYLT